MRSLKAFILLVRWWSRPRHLKVVRFLYFHSCRFLEASAIPDTVLRKWNMASIDNGHYSVLLLLACGCQSPHIEGNLKGGLCSSNHF
jgi:hypothetical protein